MATNIIARHRHERFHAACEIARTDRTAAVPSLIRILCSKPSIAVICASRQTD
ncbi:hypothetical protein RM533_12525 [Croceicoccus sp. F390]|uniref:Uncharacterized protein n=1 Tax=Croceicoccus esteveae TaxID=3075597 RepID=A0ABU2ZLT5_9SPHN|nr:hypothetical protein [Croceicoccus sp. F390]MDT0576993.1 hypothetical protein [Croceicoccus sp. F390]